MIKRVLIIGGYGNFGSFISSELAKNKNIQIIIAGRSLSKAQNLASKIKTENKSVNKISSASLDINKDLNESLDSINPDIVIHTSGPFQKQSYVVARSCIERKIHYIDLADGRDFVSGITQLHNKAKQQGVLVISGASSVPCFTSALVDYYLDQFETLEELDYGITTAQKTARGLATTAAILGYTGKPFKTIINGKINLVYGWQGLRIRKYKDLGWRFLSNCDVPDLALFPTRYPDLKTIRFYAGLEISFIHITLWILSWLVRIGLIKNLQTAAPLLLRTSFLFDSFGSANSAFHMKLSGKDKNRTDKTITFELIARSGDGPYIPCMPAILMAKKLVSNEIDKTGAYPCVGFITREEYLDALAELDISWNVE